ncbi:hypothetical protein [Acinetobacter sp.]|uniref:hypothetical protein n=1 Tax=Acinetobacter sp. TaxID=472 RepID=UPI002FCC074E
MKKFLQGALLPFGIFAAGMALLGCEQAVQADAQESEGRQSAPAAEAAAPQAELKNGSMLYMIRDVADLQLKAGSYAEQLQQSKSELQAALDQQDHAKLQQVAAELQQQLQGFNQALNSVNLTTQEISGIRQKLLAANEQALASPLLNGQAGFSPADFKQIEQQIGSIQSEMLKLASMLIQSGNDGAESAKDS